MRKHARLKKILIAEMRSQVFLDYGKLQITMHDKHNLGNQNTAKSFSEDSDGLDRGVDLV